MPCGECSHLVATKAGGFGPEDVIEQIIIKLEARR
jgi:hypothetical protein